MRNLLAGLIIMLGLAACLGTAETTPLLPTAERYLIVYPEAQSDALQAPASYSYTYLQPSGNRVLEGTGNLSQSESSFINTSGTPAWIAGAAIRDGVRWYVIMDDGRIEIVTVGTAGEIVREALDLHLPPGQPPLIDRGRGALVEGSNLDGISLLTHPVVTSGGQWLWIDNNGDLVLGDESGVEIDRMMLQALPDARLVLEGDLLAVYAGATRFYDHAVLGDGLEASSLAVLDTSEGQILHIVDVPAPEGAVFEGISPLLVDWNQDGEIEVLATASDYTSGAAFVLYGLDGGLLAQSDPIGQAYRWRHQLAVAPFQADGEWLLASVFRPHLDGVVQLHAWRGELLVEVQALAGYSSHRLGERNMDRAAVADFDGDGLLELLVADLQLRSLALLGWSDGNLIEEWRFDLGDTMLTNLGVVEIKGGGLAVAAGVQDGLWVFIVK